MMTKICATFLDEISMDIPHQNWGRADWDRDFAAMKAVGINTVVMIRCGWNRFMTYPSKVLQKYENCYMPPVDLVQMFLDLAQKYDMKFYFGNYTGAYYVTGEYQREIDINKRVGEEFMTLYGSHPAFHGWYLTQEVGRLQWNIIDVFVEIGRFYKEISGGKPALISPYLEGIKLVDAFDSAQRGNANRLTVEQHVKEWDEIMSAISPYITTVAFQDGQCDYDELADFLCANRELTDRHGLECWTNCESFDRDMPIKFLPIKWEKMLLKLKAAEKAGIKKAITFEFSHFMSPNSCYPAAHGLYRCYQEYLEGKF